MDSPLFYPKCQQRSSWSCELDSSACLTVAHSTATSQDNRNGHDPHWLQGFPDRRDADGTVRSGLEAPKTRSARTPACAALQIPGRPRVLPPDGLAIQSGGPLAAGTAHREGRRNTVKAREYATAQGSEVEDRGRAPTELAARFRAATRTRPREASRSAGTIRSHSSGRMSAAMGRCPSA
jgi:hypothetical protein